jgi:hypothetical protein
MQKNYLFGKIRFAAGFWRPASGGSLLVTKVLIVSLLIKETSTHFHHFRLSASSEQPVTSSHPLETGIQQPAILTGSAYFFILLTF